MSEDEPLYEIATRELVSAPRKGLLAKCAVETNGNIEQAQILYVKRRVVELQEAHLERERLLREKELQVEAERNQFEQTRQEQARIYISQCLKTMPNASVLLNEHNITLSKIYLESGFFNEKLAAEMIHTRKSEVKSGWRMLILVIIAQLLVLGIGLIALMFLRGS